MICYIKKYDYLIQLDKKLKEIYTNIDFLVVIRQNNHDLYYNYVKIVKLLFDVIDNIDFNTYILNNNYRYFISQYMDNNAVIFAFKNVLSNKITHHYIFDNYNNPIKLYEMIKYDLHYIAA